ncbi:MAG TPA: single-stranded-DNA-specific exonuclease RecJ, partial [Candidatus Limnocylindrales bacterium]|nr:single-stranded-DNA-specific exonuclease RecJ [Candidatus Limnocylindrales bacterium]
MMDARHRWVFPDPLHLDPALRAVFREQGIGTFAGTVMARRGIADPQALAAFLGPAIAGLHDPRKLPDAAALVERVARARSGGERVMVFGDFDADGLTGLAQLVITLRRLGMDATPYVPSRLEEGHGLSLAAVAAAETAGITLIVTVDTGSTSVAEIADAARRGIDTIITDHHHLPEVLPAAVAIVNPHRADSAYPDPRLSGSGVAFTVARLLLGELMAAEADALDLAELATIGTVSDVVPILGENRSIVRLGLERMRTAPRPGIAALLERGRVMPSAVDLETVGFVLAPRLNAAGRVGEALDAARLLLAETPEEAGELAATLEAANTTRKDLMRAAIAEARTALGLPDPGAVPGQEPLVGEARPGAVPAVVGGGSGAPALLVHGPWPVGIIGLVAGRLADETGRPAVVGTPIGSVIRASCRSDGRVNLAEALTACADLFVRFGGHAAAAGFELQADRWPEFSERFSSIVAAGGPADPRTPLAVDLALPAGYVDYSLYRDLARLAPCGPGNPEPLVAVLGLTVQRVRAANGGHTQLVLRRERDVIDGIAFGRPDLAVGLAEGDRVDVVARLASRVFGGLETLQLEVRDVAP